MSQIINKSGVMVPGEYAVQVKYMVILNNFKLFTTIIIIIIKLINSQAGLVKLDLS